VIDPAVLGSLGVIDLITSSHNHTDHLDAETLLPLLASNPQAVLVIPAANRSFVLERLRPSAAKGIADEGRACAPMPKVVELDQGVSARVGEVEIYGIAAAHPALERDESGHCRFLGYVVRWGGLSVYHSGDTLWHKQLVNALKPFTIDVALLPINGDRPERRVAGNLDGIQAAQLARAIGARVAIPCHYRFVRV